jgi:hypothetical protein
MKSIFSQSASKLSCERLMIFALFAFQPLHGGLRRVAAYTKQCHSMLGQYTKGLHTWILLQTLRN